MRLEQALACSEPLLRAEPPSWAHARTSGAALCRMLAARNLSELELGLVANLSLETPDEARKLVPTLEVRRLRGGREGGHARAGTALHSGAPGGRHVG